MVIDSNETAELDKAIQSAGSSTTRSVDAFGGSTASSRATRCHLPLYAVKLVAWFDADAETILVTVPVAATPPALSQGDHVVVERLEAMPWVQNGNARVAFRAKSVLPVDSTTVK